MKKRLARYGFLFLLPGLTGFLGFVLVPVCITVSWAAVDRSGGFVLFSNMAGLFGSEAFLCALENTGLYLAAGSGLSILCALAFASLLFRVIHVFPRAVAAVRSLYLTPLAVPSGVCVLFAHMLFASGGPIGQWSGSEVDFLRTAPYTFWVLVLIYIYKNTGYFTVIFLLAFAGIRREIYEAARCEGAGGFVLLRYVVFPQITPSFFFVFIMSIVNVFKMSRESWLLFGDYPNTSAYMFQNFIKNNLDNSNYGRAATASLFLLAVFSILVSLMIRLSERGDFSDE